MGISNLITETLAMEAGENEANLPFAKAQKNEAAAANAKTSGKIRDTKATDTTAAKNKKSTTAKTNNKSTQIKNTTSSVKVKKETVAPIVDDGPIFNKNTPAYNKRIDIRISADELEAVKIIMEKENISQSELFRGLLEHYIKTHNIKVGK